MSKIKWRVPYRRWIEGVISDSIVVYAERPYSTYPDYTETKKLIQIDLWLCILRFEWISRKAAPGRTGE